MNWRQHPEASSYLEQARVQFEQAQQESDLIRRYADLVSALNNIWTAHDRATGAFSQGKNRSDHGALIDLMNSGFSDRARELLCASQELKAAVSFRPFVMDHDVLRKDPSYDPLSESEPYERLKKKASEAHKELALAYERWTNDRTPALREKVLKKFAVVLYIVRSSVQHGHKTPRGPNLKKERRDQEVCTAFEPVLKLVIQLALSST